MAAEKMRSCDHVNKSLKNYKRRIKICDHDHKIANWENKHFQSGVWCQNF